MFHMLDKTYLALNGLPRRYKSMFLLFLDAILVPICLYIAYALRLDTITPHDGQSDFWVFTLLQTTIGIVTLLLAQQHKIKMHNFEISSVIQIAMTTAALFLSLILLLYLFRFWAPRSVPVIFSVLFFVCAISLRISISTLLNYAERRLYNAIPVAVYGTSNTAIQVLTTLKVSSNHKPLCFFDDNSALRGATIANVKVESLQTIDNMIKKGLQEVYVALPEASEQELKTIVAQITRLGLRCHITPTVTELLLNQSRNILQGGLSTEDLLGRDKLDLLSEEIRTAFQGKIVAITGAGGSIGSELSRQILDLKPKKLILFENSEFALYTIASELELIATDQGTTLVSKLGSVLDISCLEAVLRQDGVQILFHAAAYKHVPLVEKNILEAAQNNILGTYNAALTAGKLSLEKFVLISTDKAVRPANIMGATKRLAELLATSCHEKYPSTAYSVVRFGNVLGSSGSVIPLFKKQISKGGPVTVTHPDITRYFMTIVEASKLVLIAGCFADGGDTFVLDMGKPMKIVDLAKRIIELSGFTVKDHGNPEGDISIDFVGLRPGEKMFEELMFTEEEMVQTPHKKIFRVKEKTLPQAYARAIADDVTNSVLSRNQEAIMSIIADNVEGFNRSTTAERSPTSSQTS